MIFSRRIRFEGDYVDGTIIEEKNGDVRADCSLKCSLQYANEEDMWSLMSEFSDIATKMSEMNN